MLTVSREQMLEAVAILGKIPISQGVATSEQLKIETVGGLFLSAVGGISCRCILSFAIEGDSLKTVAVSRAAFCVFADVARNLDSTAPFEFELKSDMLYVKNGRRTLKLAIAKPTGNYGCSTTGDWNVVSEPKEFRQSVARALDFATTDKNQLDLFGIYLSPVGLLSGDKKSGIKLDPPRSASRYFVPKVFAELFAIQDDGKLYVSHKTIQFRSKRLVFEYPMPVKDIFPYDKFLALQEVPKQAKWLVFALGSLQAAASRFAPFMSVAGDEEKVLFAKLATGKQEVTLRLRVGGNEVRERVKLARNAEEEIEYKIPAERMLKFCVSADVKDSIGMATVETLVDADGNKRMCPLFWFKSGTQMFYLSKIGTKKEGV